MPFEFRGLSIPGLILVQPQVFVDARGFFLESFKAEDFRAAGLPDLFAQDNHSRSSKGVIRGIHFQQGSAAQGKLVRVTRGAVWDVAVDLRPDSPTRGLWEGIVLSEENATMIWIPPGFGHGFLALTEVVDFQYRCTTHYQPETESGVIWNDPDLAISWPLDDMKPLVSERDNALPRLRDFRP